MSTNDSKPTVLLIDDSLDVHRLLQARLRHEQIRLIGATRGGEALEIARAKAPSAILLDLDMPDMDGFEVLRRLKDDGSTHNVPVIVLSGLNGSEDKVTAFDLGATDYVTKPFDLSELRARLRAALRTDHLLRLLAERADVDGLTGLGNRAHFNKRWAEKVSECKRYRQPLTLAMIDLDHFKRVNDTYGHPAGDEVIQGLGQLLQRECRQHDVACRYGGEEFALIMPHTPTNDGALVAERIRQALMEMVWPRHTDYKVTMSIGLVGSDGQIADISPAEWIEAADKNLYTAKHSGRNMIISNALPSAIVPVGKAA